MASTLFPVNSKSSLIGNVKKLVNGNPQAMFDSMYASNDQFRQFADSMKGKTPQQAFAEHGLSFDDFKNLR